MVREASDAHCAESVEGVMRLDYSGVGMSCAVDIEQGGQHTQLDCTAEALLRRTRTFLGRYG